MYPVFFGKEYSSLYARSIEKSTIEGVILPLIMNPGEVRMLKIHFSIEKSNLDNYADKLKDSSHIIIFKDGHLLDNCKDLSDWAGRLWMPMERIIQIPDVLSLIFSLQRLWDLQTAQL